MVSHLLASMEIFPGKVFFVIPFISKHFAGKSGENRYLSSADAGKISCFPCN